MLFAMRFWQIKTNARFIGFSARTDLKYNNIEVRIILSTSDGNGKVLCYVSEKDPPPKSKNNVEYANALWGLR